MPVKITDAKVAPIPVTDAKRFPGLRWKPHRECVICGTPTTSRTVPPPGVNLYPVHLCSWCAHVVSDVARLPMAEQSALWTSWAEESYRFRNNVIGKRIRTNAARRRASP